MPRISRTEDYNGVAEKIRRLGLSSLYEQVVETLSFQLLVEERRFANGTQIIRKMIDERFENVGGWKEIRSGGIDWTATTATGSTIGVEVQVSGRSDLLAVDVMHFKRKLASGDMDVGVIVVPDDVLSAFLTDRTPNFRTAVRHVVEHGAADLPIRIVAFMHDGVGPALPKARTNLGRLP